MCKLPAPCTSGTFPPSFPQLASLSPPASPHARRLAPEALLTASRSFRVVLAPAASVGPAARPSLVPLYRFCLYSYPPFVCTSLSWLSPHFSVSSSSTFKTGFCVCVIYLLRNLCRGHILFIFSFEWALRVCVSAP